jgi:hypothetical protein
MQGFLVKKYHRHSMIAGGRLASYDIQHQKIMIRIPKCCHFWSPTRPAPESLSGYLAKNSNENETGEKEHGGIGDEVFLVTHPQDDFKKASRTISTPQNADSSQDKSYCSLSWGQRETKNSWNVRRNINVVNLTTKIADGKYGWARLAR